jgi:hypothetical protein
MPQRDQASGTSIPSRPSFSAMSGAVRCSGAAWVCEAFRMIWFGSISGTNRQDFSRTSSNTSSLIEIKSKAIITTRSAEPPSASDSRTSTVAVSGSSTPVEIRALEKPVSITGWSGVMSADAQPMWSGPGVGRSFSAPLAEAAHSGARIAARATVA